MDNWVIIDDNDIVQNVIVWDGTGNLNLPETWSIVQAPGAKIGWYWNNGNQLNPNEPITTTTTSTTTTTTNV